MLNFIQDLVVSGEFSAEEEDLSIKMPEDNGEVISDDDEAIGTLNTPKLSLSANTFNSLTVTYLAMATNKKPTFFSTTQTASPGAIKTNLNKKHDS